MLSIKLSLQFRTGYRARQEYIDAGLNRFALGGEEAPGTSESLRLVRPDSKEALWAIVMLMEWPGVTREEYDRVMKALRLDEETPAGGILHVAGGDGGTWRVLDVWESEDAWNRFQQDRLMPAVQETGLTDKGQPNVRVYDVHNVFAPGVDEIRRMGASPLAAARA